MIINFVWLEFEGLFFALKNNGKTRRFRKTQIFLKSRRDATPLLTYFGNRRQGLFAIKFAVESKEGTCSVFCVFVVGWCGGFFSLPFFRDTKRGRLQNSVDTNNIRALREKNFSFWALFAFAWVKVHGFVCFTPWQKKKRKKPSRSHPSIRP